MCHNDEASCSAGIIVANNAQSDLGSLLLIALLVIVYPHPLPAAESQVADAESLRQEGLDHLRNRQFGRAVEAYEKALELDPGNEILYLESADILLGAGLPEDVEAVLGRARSRFPDSRDPAYNLLYHDLAEAWAASGRLARAAEAMTAAARVAGPIDAALVQKRIGDFSTDLLRLDAALDAYRRALELDPGNPVTRLALGTLQLRRNALDDAFDVFSGLLSDYPQNPDALHGIAEIHRRRGEFEAALEAADGVLASVPEHRGALYIRGTALVRLGRREEGTESLERYRELQASAQAEEHRLRDINAFRAGGMDLVIQGRYEEAIALFEGGVRAYPDAAPLQISLGEAQAEAGRHRDAIATFLGMLERGIGQPRLAHESLAREYRAVGDDEAGNRHQSLAADFQP